MQSGNHATAKLHTCNHELARSYAHAKDRLPAEMADGHMNYGEVTGKLKRACLSAGSALLLFAHCHRSATKAIQ